MNPGRQLINPDHDPERVRIHRVTIGDLRFDMSNLRSARESYGLMISQGIVPTGYVKPGRCKYIASRRHWVTRLIGWLMRDVRIDAGQWEKFKRRRK